MPDKRRGVRGGDGVTVLEAATGAKDSRHGTTFRCLPQEVGRVSTRSAGRGQARAHSHTPLKPRMRGGLADPGGAGTGGQRALGGKEGDQPFPSNGRAWKIPRKEPRRVGPGPGVYWGGTGRSPGTSGGTEALCTFTRRHQSVSARPRRLRSLHPTAYKPTSTPERSQPRGGRNGLSPSQTPLRRPPHNLIDRSLSACSLPEPDQACPTLREAFHSGVWLARWAERASLDLSVVSSSATLGVGIT